MKRYTEESRTYIVQLAQQLEQWEKYYSSLPMVEPDESTTILNEQFAAMVCDLVPEGGSVLEAGCGGGWQSLAIASKNRDVALLDFSQAALDYSRRVFERAGIRARFIEEDIFTPGSPEFDLVFNAGVLEHYTPEQQARMIQAMAVRSRRYVAVLVPNASCYWYWLWRMHMAADGQWAWGKEIPVASLKGVFEKAGLHYVGTAHLGASWTEAFIRGVPGMDPALAERLIMIHRTAIIPESQKAYLVAGLGAIEPVTGLAGSWASDPDERFEDAHDLRADLSDALAEVISLNRQRIAAERRLADLAASDGVRNEAALFHGENPMALRQQSEDSENKGALESRLLVASRSNRDLTLRLESHHQESGRLLQAEISRRKAVENHASQQAARLEQAESVRRSVAGRIRDYDQRLDSLLTSIRSQRAWTVMLQIRRAYALWFRHGWAGRWELFRRPFAGPAELKRYDWDFPAVEPLLPDSLFEAAASVSGPAGPAGIAPTRTEHRYDLIVLPIFDFEFRFQRPQQLAAQFARLGHRTFWVSPTRQLPAGEDGSMKADALRDNLWEVRLGASIPPLYGRCLTDEEAAALEICLTGLIQELRLAAITILVQFPSWYPLAQRLRERFGAKIVYDMMDDWQNWPTEPLIGSSNLEAERRLIAEADVLTVSSREFSDRHSAHLPLLVPNGADFEFFHAGVPGTRLDAYRKPIVGYYGAIAEWFDLELVFDAAKARPHYTFILIGQVHLVDVSRLESLPNVHFLGEKNYRELPAYLAAFDTCLIPFRLSNLIKGVDPVKLYEYLSQGKAVVATAMPEIERLSELIYIARDRDRFLGLLDQAVAENDPEVRSRRIAFARENTWRARAEAIDAKTRTAFPLVSVIVVTYNSERFLRPLWDSIRCNTSYPNYEVIFVDNASKDNTPALIEQLAAADSRIRSFGLDHNLGFAGGNNYGVARSSGSYIVLLNPDVLVTAGWIERLMRPLQADSTIGLVAPVTNFSGNETKIDVDYANLADMEAFSVRRAVAGFGRTVDISCAPLLCALFTRRLWDQIGELDTRFEVGMFEDDDFSLRVRRAGLRIVTAEDCFIHHFGNGAFESLPSAESQRIFTENRRRYEEKWGVAWTPHQHRAGVRPLSMDRRYQVDQFTGGASPRQELAAPEILRVDPATATAGVAVNPQPDGSGAVTIFCSHATPDTVVLFDTGILPTTYCSPDLLTAALDPALHATPGLYKVRILNHFGASEALPFLVQDEGAA